MSSSGFAGYTIFRVEGQSNYPSTEYEDYMKSSENMERSAKDRNSRRKKKKKKNPGTRGKSDPHTKKGKA